MSKEKITFEDFRNLLLRNIDKEKQSRKELIELLNNNSSPYAVMGLFNNEYLTDKFYSQISLALLNELSSKDLTPEELNKIFKKFFKAEVENILVKEYQQILIKSDLLAYTRNGLGFVFIHHRAALSIFHSNFKRYKIVSQEEFDNYEMDNC